MKTKVITAQPIQPQEQAATNAEKKADVIRFVIFSHFGKLSFAPLDW